MKEWTTLKKLIWLYAAKLKGGAQAIIETITGTLPLVLQNALPHAIVSLTRYGLCTQDGTPTPNVPVDIVCNNGALKFGWYDIITTSALSGYGTYVSPSGTAGNRAYKWFKDLPNGTYTFAVDGDYEIIVQWRDPADPSVLVPSSYENLSGWMTSGEAVLDKESGGYGIAVRRTSGTSSITPSNFDGTLHVQEQGIYTDGTPEVLTVSVNLLNTETNTMGYYLSAGGRPQTSYDAQYTDLIPVIPGHTYTWSLTSNRGSKPDSTNRWHGYDEGGVWVKQITYKQPGAGDGVPFSLTATIPDGIAYVRLSYARRDTDEEFCDDSIIQTASVPMLLSVGDTKDEAELISGIKTGKVGVLVLDGTENFYVATGDTYGVAIDKTKCPGSYVDAVPVLCTHLPFSTSSSTSQTDVICNRSGNYGIRMLFDETIMALAGTKVEAAKAFIASEYAKGTPIIVVYPLATETTEQTTAQHLSTYEGTNIVESVANVGPVEAEVKYMAASAQDVLSKLLGMKVTKNDISTQDAEEMIDIITGEENK